MTWIARAFLCLAPAALLMAGCAPTTEPAEPVGEWRQFRGPQGLGVSSEENLPVFWKEGSSQILWRATVPGAGNSSPIISGGKVFLTTTYGYPNDTWDAVNRYKELKRVVLAYDVESGEKLWETVLFEGPVGKRHWSNTHAAPTPVTDGRHVFVSFDAHLAALDFDGNVVWHRDVDPDYYVDSHYGVSSSPVLAAGALILLQDKEEGESEFPGWIAAFDKSNGEEIWRDEWTHTCCSYNTPLVVEREDGLEIWNQTALEVVGYDAKTGERRWQSPIPSMQTVPSMVRHEDLFAAPGGIHHRQLAMFHICPGSEGTDPVAVWSKREGSPEMSSPVIYNGKLFSVSKGGAFYVQIPRTGQIIWQKRLPLGEYRSSLVAGDGKVYVFNDRGTTTVIDAAADKPRILSRNELPVGSSASPAIAAESIFLRVWGELLRIGKSDAGEAAGEPAGEGADEGADEGGDEPAGEPVAAEEAA